jgi:hypothetical protein
LPWAIELLALRAEVVDFFKMEGFAMPISGPTSYVPTAQGFHGHWVLADQTLGQGNEIVLHDGTTAADLNTKTDALVAKRASVKAKLNLAEASRGDVENKKRAMIVWVKRFNKRIRARFPGSKWLAALPVVPAKGAAQGPFVEPLDDEDVIANIQPDQPRVHLTLEGLPEPGTTAGYKVYVMVNTGNEKGSKAKIVHRPAPPET